MTIKDIYLIAHAAAVSLEANLGPVKLLDAKLAAWENALATPDIALTDADFPAFEAHLEESYRRLTRLAAMPSDSTVLANQTAQKTARLAGLKKLQTAQTAQIAPVKPATVAAPVASGTPAVAPAPTGEPAAQAPASERAPATGTPA